MLGDVVRKEIIQAYAAGEDILKVRELVSPPLTTYMLYKILELENIPLRGKMTRRNPVGENTKLKCSGCSVEKPATHFSKHKATVIGYDTSQCKECKKSERQWADLPMEKRIYNRAKARAIKNGLAFNLELSDIVLPDVCPVFNVPFEYGHRYWTYSIDRIDPKLGYIKGNIQIISNRANVLKNDATLQEIEKLFLWMQTLDKEPSVPFWKQTW